MPILSIHDEILERKEAIGMAATVLAAISKDKHERAKFMSQRKDETDMTSNVLTAEKRGVMKVARNMKDAGLPTEQIVQMSGLTVAEIEKLKAKGQEYYTPARLAKIANCL